MFRANLPQERIPLRGEGKTSRRGTDAVDEEAEQSLQGCFELRFGKNQAPEPEEMEIHREINRGEGLEGGNLPPDYPRVGSEGNSDGPEKDAVGVFHWK